MNRFAIISDIHGNFHALEAVLADIEKIRVDQIIVNGDLVNRGPHNDKVMERLWNKGYIFTLGNHDALMWRWLDRHPDIPAAWFDDPFWGATAWSVEQLVRSGWMDKLRSLPMTHELVVDNAPRILLSHGSPRHYREGYGPFLPADNFLQIIEEFPADIYIGAHTHRPDEREIVGKTFLNTGAVGAPFNGNARAQYLLLTLEDDGWHWEFRTVPYDRAAALTAYTDSGLLADGGVSALIFMTELQYALPIYPLFWDWAENEKIAMDWPAWNKFVARFGSRLVEPQE